MSSKTHHKEMDGKLALAIGDEIRKLYDAPPAPSGDPQEAITKEFARSLAVIRAALKEGQVTELHPITARCIDINNADDVRDVLQARIIVLEDALRGLISATTWREHWAAYQQAVKVLP